MLRVLPHVAGEPCFALKGGTAINFFVRDMPRLSVDIDLTYIPVEPRRQSLERIGQALARIKEKVLRTIPQVEVHEVTAEGAVRRLLVRGAEGMVKVEPNVVVRGTVYAPVERSLSRRVEERFGLAVAVKVLSLADLFGGKICAALDRQHPRDLFDVKLLLENEGLTTRIRKAFIVYWVSHDRPMHELIDPNRKDFRELFENEFTGMTDQPVGYEALVGAREDLIDQLRRDLTDEERRFVVSVKEGKPAWGLLGIEGLDTLPAIQWKLHNIRRMAPEKHREYLRKLKEAL